jgi:hypothetical protein
VHQALRAVRQFDSPKILLIGIAPAFGAFGNAWSDNVKQYVRDVEQTRAKFCMIASEDDGFTWRQGGAAYPRKVGYRGDNDVGRAIRNNRSNVTVMLLSGADHSPIDEYLRHGLVQSMRKCASRFGFDRTAIGDVVYGRVPRESQTEAAQAPAGRAAPPPRPSTTQGSVPAPPPPSAKPSGSVPAPPPPPSTSGRSVPAPPPPPSTTRGSAPAPAPPPPSVQP